MKNLSVSRFKTAKFETQGEYNNTKIKKEIALDLFMFTTLILDSKDEISSLCECAEFKVAKVDTISSFASNPTNNAHTTPALFNPIGANKNFTLSARINKMLLSMS